MKIPLSNIRVKNFDQVAHLLYPMGVEFLTREQVEFEIVYAPFARGIRKRLSSVIQTQDPGAGAAG